MTNIGPLESMPWSMVLIDDSEDDKAEVRSLLLRGSERRYNFSEAQTGAAGVALVLAACVLPDCVLLDYNLPDMDALDVLKALAGPDGLPVCPVVVLTGGAGPEARRAVLRAGAQDYIGKDRGTVTAMLVCREVNIWLASLNTSLRSADSNVSTARPARE